MWVYFSWKINIQSVQKVRKKIRKNKEMIVFFSAGRIDVLDDTGYNDMKG